LSRWAFSVAASVATGFNKAGPSGTGSITWIGACRNNRSASRGAGIRVVPQVEVAFTP
jgi:hypothetical protein